MTAEKKRAEAVRLIKSREGKNNYSQNRPAFFFGYPSAGKNPGRSDCSSTVGESLKRAAGLSIGGNTSAQIDNRRKGEVVEMGISEGRAYPTETKLKLGDCIYFKGNKGHSLEVGHVEMYIGDGKCIGHGSGKGPVIRSLKNYALARGKDREYLCTIRWILDDEEAETYSLGQRPLSLGMIAPEVGELQKLLIGLNYSLGAYGPNKDGVDNEYGELTAKAIMDVQTDHSLMATGDADVVTIRAVMAAAGKTATAHIKQRIKVTGGTVYVRSGPGTTYKQLAIVRSGDLFDASGRSAEGWYGLLYKGTSAWISAKYAEITE